MKTLRKKKLNGNKREILKAHSSNTEWGTVFAHLNATGKQQLVCPPSLTAAKALKETELASVILAGMCFQMHPVGHQKFLHLLELPQ